MIRKYEGCFLLKADLTDQDVEKEAAFIEEVLKRHGGEIVRKDIWGRKTLAYPVRKKQEAFYYVFYFSAPAKMLAEAEPTLRGRENILRYLFLQRTKLPEPVKEVVATEETEKGTENVQSKPE